MAFIVCKTEKSTQKSTFSLQNAPVQWFPALSCTILGNLAASTVEIVAQGALTRGPAHWALSPWDFGQGSKANSAPICAALGGSALALLAAPGRRPGGKRCVLAWCERAAECLLAQGHVWERSLGLGLFLIQYEPRAVRPMKFCVRVQFIGVRGPEPCPFQIAPERGVLQKFS